MPQIQMLPAAPGFGSQLGAALGGGLGQGIQEGIGRYLKQKEMTNLLESLGVSTPKQPSPLRGKSPEAVADIPAIQAIGPQTGPQQQGSLQNLRPEQLVAATIMNPELGKTLGTIYQAQQQQFEKQRSYETERANKYLDKISAAAEGIPERRASINSAVAAVQSGQMKPFGGDFWADVLNAPQLRTATGAQLSTAAKTNLIGSLSQVTGGRPNQFIEQQISNSFAKAGQTKEANMSQLEIIRSILDMDEKRVEVANQLADQQRAQYGYPLESIDRETQKIIKPYADQRMKELAYDLQENVEKYMSVDQLSKIKSVARGTPLTVERAQILLEKVGGDEKKAMQLAEKLGYEIPSEEIYGRIR